MKLKPTTNVKRKFRYRVGIGTIAEFGPAFVLLMIAFFAILTSSQILFYEMAAQKCCLDAATLAASSLTIKSGTALVQQQAKSFNSGLGKMLLLDSGKNQLSLQLTWTPVVPTKEPDQPSTERYATVTGEIAIQPFYLPMAIKLSSSAQCVLEHPEGWVPKEPDSSGIRTY
jgi:hypothetical protein